MNDNENIGDTVNTPEQCHREHIINHEVLVKFEQNRYTTPVTILFTPLNHSDIGNIAANYRKNFVCMKVVDPSYTIITSSGLLRSTKNFVNVLYESRNKFCNDTQ